MAVAKFVASQPGIDPARVGFAGISQGGWIIPEAIVRAGSTVSWAVIESGPTVTEGEADFYAQLVASGESFANAEAEAKASGAGGYDPGPWIRRLGVPVLWLYGGQDRAQPSQHSRELLAELSPGHDFTVAYYPTAPHVLFGQSGFAAGLFGAVRDWLAAHHLATSCCKAR